MESVRTNSKEQEYSLELLNLTRIKEMRSIL